MRFVVCIFLFLVCLFFFFIFCSGGLKWTDSDKLIDDDGDDDKQDLTAESEKHVGWRIRRVKANFRANFSPLSMYNPQQNKAP